MASNKCYTYFNVSGDFDVEELSALLELQPFSYHSKGDLMPDGTLRGESSASYSKCDFYGYGYITEQMQETIKPLLDKVTLLRKLKKMYNLAYYLSVVPSIYTKEDNYPCLAPSLEVMQFCCDTGTEMDVDMYIYL